MTEENIVALSEAALASLALPNLINPVLDKMEKNDSVSVNKTNLKSVLTRIDQMCPAFSIDFVNELVRVHNKQVNMNEMILRSEKFATSEEYFIKRPEFKELNLRAKQLKNILSRIPDEINDRKAFLETIK